VGRRLAILVRESFGFWDRASPWIRHGECDRRTIPAAETFYHHQETLFEGLVRAALGPLARRRLVVDTTVTMSGFTTWAAFHDRGVPTTESAALVIEVLARWIGEAGMATKIANGGKRST
jgi:hypothetical protein